MEFVQFQIELSERELEIVALLGDGLTNQEIADRTGLTLYTIKWYLKQIFSKLHVSNRAQAVSKVLELGLLDTSTPPVRVTNNLPQTLTPFFGREQELNQLEALLLQDRVRLITLHGTGGMGKTRLALEVAHRLRGAFLDGVFFVALGQASFDPIQQIANTLAIPVDRSAGVLTEVSGYLRNRHCLLILDNFEQLTDQASRITALLQRTQALHIIVTSREVLRVQGETIFPLQGMSLPHRLDDMEDSGAYQLFVQCARAVYPRFSPSANEKAAIGKVCALVGGMPLAIELAAGWASVLSVQETEQRLRHGLDLLDSGEQDRPQRQQSIRATLDYSWHLLTPQVQRVLVSLGAFHHKGFTLAGAEAVAGASPAIMKQLVDAALVQRTGSGRFAFHPLIQQYIMERLEGDAELWASARQAHGQYYLDFVMRHIEALRAEMNFATVQSFRAEMDNLYQAWEYALDQGLYDWLESAAEVGYLCDLADLWKEADYLFRMTLAALPEHLTLLRGRLIAFRAIFVYRQHDFEKHIGYALESWDMLKESQYVGDAATAMAFYAVSMALRGQLAESMPYIDELEPLLEPAARIPCSYSRFYLSCTRGVATLFARDPAAALPLLEAMPRIAWHDLSLHLPEAYMELGQTEKARQGLQEMVEAGLEQRKYRAVVAAAFYLAVLDSGPEALAADVLRIFTEVAHISGSTATIARLVQYFGRYNLARGKPHFARLVFRTNLHMLDGFGATTYLYRYALETSRTLAAFDPARAEQLTQALASDPTCPPEIRQRATPQLGMTPARPDTMPSGDFLAVVDHILGVTATE